MHSRPCCRLIQSSVRHQHGLTPLHRAAYFDHYSVCALLLDSGADIEARNKVLLQINLLIDGPPCGLLTHCGYQNGWTPLLRAVLKGNTGVCALLLDRGANIEATNHVRRTHIVCSSDNSSPTVTQPDRPNGVAVGSAQWALLNLFAASGPRRACGVH